MPKVAKTPDSSVDPFTVTTEKRDMDKFASLDFWGQLDAAVNNASKPDLKKLPLFFVGGAWWCINAAVCVGLTWYSSGSEMWTSAFHEALLKNTIAYDGIASHHGFSMCYRVLVGQPEYNNKFRPGSIKEPHNSVVASIPGLGGQRRTNIDILGHVAWDLARVWLIISREPSPQCAWLIFGTMAWMYLFDHGEYVGVGGMYHGPWSVFILAKYYTASEQAAATSMLQALLILLYVGCGLGKMGPWFVAVFNQEWTLPPWAATLDLRPHLYTKDFPRDNTPSALAVALGYLAAVSEWVAPLLLMAPSSIVGGDAGSISTCVFFGIATIVTMHLYINVHIPAFDVWMLNFTPAYLVYNAFYLCPTLPEPGFDYVGFATLHPAFRYFCYFMAVYCTYGQLFPESMTYLFCYRFWAGNWPQAWVLVSESGMKKVEKAFPVQLRTQGKPGAVYAGMDGDNWAFNWFGVFQTAQLPHRAMPMAVHRAMVMGAKARGEEPPKTLSEFQNDRNGFFALGSQFFNWVSGWMVNDAQRGRYVMAEMQKESRFTAGEFMLVESSSFPVFGGMYGAKSHWSITDASQIADAGRGVVAEGHLTIDEALAITRPSVWAGYEDAVTPRAAHLTLRARKTTTS